MKITSLFFLTLSIMIQVFLAPSISYGGDFTVTRFDDPPPDGCNPDDCSLREAVIAANADADSSTITLEVGDYVLTQTSTNEDSALDGDLDITEDLAILGKGSTQTSVDASAIMDRVFHILNSAMATFNGLEITGGSDATNGGGIEVGTSGAELDDVALIGNSSNLNGAGLNIGSGGTATVMNSLVQNNIAGGNSGGLYLQSGSLEVYSTQVIGNKADGNGGGLYIQGGTLIVRDVELEGNLADADISGSGSGGGIYIQGGTTTISQTLLFNNSARNGGGIRAGNAMVIINSTLSGNQAVSDGKSGGDGGGIYASTADVGIFNTTITLNEAVRGGGFFTQVDDPETRINNSIIAQNSSGGDCAASGGGPLTNITSLGYNLDGDDTCDFNATGDQRGVDAKLNPLNDNGGPTRTHTLQSDSTAIDGGDPSGCMDDSATVILVDQRGITRPQGPALICDIGAVEMEFADLEVSKSVDNGEVPEGDAVTFTITVTNLGPNEASNVTLTDTLPPGLGFISAAPSQGTCVEGGGVLTCDLGTISSGGSVNITVLVSADQEGNFTNTATVSYPDVDTNPDNNTASVSFVIIQGDGGEIFIFGAGCSLNRPDKGAVNPHLVYLLAITWFIGLAVRKRIS